MKRVMMDKVLQWRLAWKIMPDFVHYFIQTVSMRMLRMVHSKKTLSSECIASSEARKSINPKGQCVAEMLKNLSEV